MVYGLVNIPKIPVRFRNKIRTIHKNLGQKKFYQKLLKLDPNSKNKVISTDVQRTIRAYEVKKFTNKSLHDWYEDTESYFKKKDFLKIYIDCPREKLILKINQRILKMIKMGAIREVKEFIKLKIKKDKSANKAIGISEIIEYFENKAELKDVIEKISIKTRQYAKRQNTWARGQMKEWKKISPQKLSKFIKMILV